MGSGHFLVFALPILVTFRMQEEDLTREYAIEAVLRDNLFGLELDQRCTQIAAFNLAMAAWRLSGYSYLPSLNLACSGLPVNAREEEWLKLAERDLRLRSAMKVLYKTFQQGPLLGSLIDPNRFTGDLLAAGFAEAKHLVEHALATESKDESQSEFLITAKGLADAARILSRKFTLVVTNVPYLIRNKQELALREFCKTLCPDGASDLATVFLDRCQQFCASGGTTAVVSPQNWLFLGSYATFRRRLLKTQMLTHVTQIGSGATATASWDVLRALSTITNLEVSGDYSVSGQETDVPEETARSAEIRRGQLVVSRVSEIIGNPDHRISFSKRSAGKSLSDYAICMRGIVTGDTDYWVRKFWELDKASESSQPLQGTVEKTTLYGGRSQVINWLTNGKGMLRPGTQNRSYGRPGVAITQMRSLPATLYCGELYDNNTGVIVPKDRSHVAALWTYCSSDRFNEEVRRIDRKINVTNATLVKVPFDLEYWIEVANAKYPGGLPEPFSTDPTQWIFHGQPVNSNTPLQISVARMLGYRWPRQTGSNFPDCRALKPDGVESHANVDAIVCLSSIKGQLAADERLRALLADAYGADWSAAKLVGLLADVNFEDETLDDWLRDGFFAQHCELFHQRPFVWHIWDGRRDGFNALVNYHRLAAANGEGRQTLEKLIYTYLGAWIDLQRADQKKGVEGADARVAAAEHLKVELEKVLTGEPLYDIFVRWKPLAEQPIGWGPDINDGVRVNIRPFMTARPFLARAASTCILRATPKIKWDRDRGKEPHRAREDFPWFWGWDGKTQDFTGGATFDGDRWNDLHYTNAFKRAAREQNAAPAAKARR